MQWRDEGEGDCVEFCWNAKQKCACRLLMYEEKEKVMAFLIMRVVVAASHLQYATRRLMDGWIRACEIALTPSQQIIDAGIHRHAFYRVVLVVVVRVNRLPLVPLDSISRTQIASIGWSTLCFFRFYLC
uniref:Uncharacterized protein n=1 Tax=Kalanchoe fedtschenkoi TaxID=63787 RepID=A0A7N0UEF0_KALFE